jgi:SNF2 family DNA or RNA helicase
METITPNTKFKTQPYKHQLECLNKFGRKKAFALLAEMGTGKTWIIINNIADLWSSGDCDSVLVFAPNGVHTNWTRLELPKHMPDWVRYKAVPWIAGGRKAEVEEIETLYEPRNGELRIMTMNWEALQSKKGVEAAKRFALCSGKLMIVCDESDSVKNPTAKRTQNLMALKPYSHWRRIMSGTPINNAPFDAFSQFSFLDEHILQTTSFYAFKAEYAEMLQPGNPLLDNIKARTKSRGTPQVVARGPGGRPKYRNLDKLSALIAPHSFRVLKSECLDLPEKIYKTLVFNMTPEQIKTYKKAEKECRLVFESEETPFNKLVAVTKLAQITSGYYIHPLSEEPVRIEGKNPKLDLLKDRVQKIIESGEKVIIWARYRIEIEDIVATLTQEGINCVQYHGGIAKDDRTAAIDSFENGNAQVFVGNQQAGGTGITLVAASYVIYFSNNFSLRDRLQSEDRAHRIGQTKNVTYINIAAKGTIDMHVIGALTNKKDVADTIIDKGLKIFS